MMRFCLDFAKSEFMSNVASAFLSVIYSGTVNSKFLLRFVLLSYQEADGA